jgi:DNA-binding CsgD family transcriptional regulator
VNDKNATMRKKGSLGAPEKTTRVESGPASSSVGAGSRKARSHGVRAVPGKVSRGSLLVRNRVNGISPLGLFILEKLDRGVVLLDADGAVVDANAVAQKAIAGAHGLSVRNRRLAFSDPRIDERFVRMLVTGRGGSSRAFAASLKSSGGLPCRVVIAATNARVTRRDVRFVALVYASDGARNISAELLAQLYGLTRAQANVARKLYEGYSVEETATLLKLSLNTVRTHLKQIFSKCEVQSQAELLRTLATGPQTL